MNMQRKPIITLVAAACVAASATVSPASAHDTPLVFVEAMKTHLRDCPSANGFMPGGNMLSPDWEKFDADNDLLATRVEEFMGDGPTPLRNVNLYRKQMEGLDLIQFMGLRTVLAEGVDPESDTLSPQDVIANEFECVTIVPDLPFMPSGPLLSAVFGEDVDVSVENTPGDTRTGAWVWEDISPTHIKTVASHTDAESAERLLAEDRIFYRGFYISSLRRFTPDQVDEADEGSVQQ